MHSKSASLRGAVTEIGDDIWRHLETSPGDQAGYRSGTTASVGT